LIELLEAKDQKNQTALKFSHYELEDIKKPSEIKMTALAKATVLST